MADDLNDFLRKAAARRQARTQGSASLPADVPPPQQAKQQRTVIAEQPIYLEPIDVNPSNSSSVTPEPVSRFQTHVPTERHLATNIERADDRMDARLHTKFDHSVSTMGQSTKKKKQKGSPKQSTPARLVENSSSPTTFNVNVQNSSNATYDVIGTSIKKQAVDREQILKMIRNSDSLRTAFIVSQIFDRKF